MSRMRSRTLPSAGMTIGTGKHRTRLGNQSHADRVGNRSQWDQKIAPARATSESVAQNDTQQRVVDLQAAVVLDES